MLNTNEMRTKVEEKGQNGITEGEGKKGKKRIKHPPEINVRVLLSPNVPSHAVIRCGMRRGHVALQRCWQPASVSLDPLG